VGIGAAAIEPDAGPAGQPQARFAQRDIGANLAGKAVIVEGAKAIELVLGRDARR
jgi:hypothetical protein